VWFVQWKATQDTNTRKLRFFSSLIALGNTLDYFKRGFNIILYTYIEEWRVERNIF